MANGLRGRLLKRRLTAMGVGQRHLAAVLGTVQPVLSEILNEKIPMPRGYSRRMLAVAGRINEQAEHSKRCGCRKERQEGNGAQSAEVR